MLIVRKALRLGLPGACFGLAMALAACSSSSANLVGAGPSSVDSGSGADGSATTTACSTLSGSEFEDTASCFVTVPVLQGLCRRDPTQNRTLGIEQVCVVDTAGELFVVAVDTDTYLYGDGWTIGPRAAPDSVTATSTPLSAADETRCSRASQISAEGASASLCTDAGSADAGDAAL